MQIKKLLKKYFFVLILTVGFAIVFSIGSSTAIFVSQNTGASTKTVTGNLSVTLLSSSGGNLESLNINTKPMSDEVALNSTNINNNLYSFVLNNDGNTPYNYSVSLNSTGTSPIKYEYIRYCVIETKSGSYTGSFSSSTLTGALTINQSNCTPHNLGDTGTIIINDFLAEPENDSINYKAYQLKIWVEDANEYLLPNNILGASLNLNLNITGEAKTTKTTIVPDLESIRITSNPTKTTYKVGEDISTSGMVIKAKYGHNENEVTITDYTIRPTVALSGTDKFIVSYTYGNYTKTLEVPISVGIILTDSTGTIKKTKSELAIGDLVTIGTEQFYVIPNEQGTVVDADGHVRALAKYNLLVGSNCDGSGSNCTAIDTTTEGYGIQNETAKGWDNSNPRVGTTEYGINNQYTGSIVEGYVNTYVDNVLKPIAGNNITGRLIKSEELNKLGCELYNGCSGAPGWVDTTSYWSETSGPRGCVYSMWSNGDYHADADFDYENNLGVRPVIVF